MIKVVPAFTLDEKANDIINRHVSKIAEEYVTLQLESFRDGYGVDHKTFVSTFVPLNSPSYNKQVSVVFPYKYPVDKCGIEFQEVYEKVRDKYRFYILDDTEKYVVHRCIDNVVSDRELTRQINEEYESDEYNEKYRKHLDKVSIYPFSRRKASYLQDALEEANGYENAQAILQSLMDVRHLSEIFPDLSAVSGI